MRKSAIQAWSEYFNSLSVMELMEGTREPHFIAGWNAAMLYQTAELEKMREAYEWRDIADAPKELAEGQYMVVSYDDGSVGFIEGPDFTEWEPYTGPKEWLSCPVKYRMIKPHLNESQDDER